MLVRPVAAPEDRDRGVRRIEAAEDRDIEIEALGG
jgi:hypothetical protein